MPDSRRASDAGPCAHVHRHSPRSPKPPGALGEWRCTWAHGPASDALRESGIPFAAPAHGKSVPDVGVSDRRWLSAAVWARIQRIQHGTTWYLQSHLEWDRLW